MEPLDANRHLQKIKLHVGNHIGDRLTLQEAASLVGLNPSYFSRLFHKEAGVRFRDWLVAQRVAHAKELLVTRPMSVTQVSFSSGFGSVSAFERAFKKHVGETPYRYQQRMRLERLVKKRRESVKQCRD